MQPRFVGRLGLADAVTVCNAALGFLAAVAATVDVSLAARLILLGAVADGLDGLVARKRGSTPAGKHLDSLADVATFGVAPSLLIAVVALNQWSYDAHPLGVVVGLVLPALFVAMAVTRLGLYNAYDVESNATEGVQTTLAATILAAGVLSGFVGPVRPVLLVFLSGVLALLMVSTVEYPDLHWQDASVMGIVQAAAILLTGYYGHVFAFGLLFLALSYLVFGPRFYWRDGL